MIKYTRHSKRRMKLYGITEANVEELIKLGNNTILEGNKIESLFKIENKKLPLKVVYKMNGNDYIIITCYPLKRGIQR